MADIFISYSKRDQAEARLLAAFLQAAGHDVWWDTSQLSGDQFRIIMMEELAKAKAATLSALLAHHAPSGMEEKKDTNRAPKQE